MLADFFFKTIRSSDRRAWVFIDGLDGCDEESRIELLAAYKEQLPSIPGLKVCISSRYYAETENLLQDAFKARMHEDPERDAAIVSHTVIKRLPFLDDPLKDVRHHEALEAGRRKYDLGTQGSQFTSPAQDYDDC